MWNSSTSLKTTRAVRNDDAGLNAAFFLLPCASEPASRFQHRRAARLRRPPDSCVLGDASMPLQTRHTRFFKNKSKGPHTVHQNRSDGPAYGAGALRLSRGRSKYTAAALNNIIHEVYSA